MSKSSLWLVGILVLGAGCAGADPGEEADQGAAEVAENAPLAVIKVSEGRRIEFFTSGPDILVAQRYPLGEAAILSEADKQLTAPELYRKFAPANSAIPDVLLGEGEPIASEPAKLVSPISSSCSGGGQPVPAARTGDIERATAALNLGDGCNPPQSNVVFADCRRNWFGGYFAEGVATWNLDSRVQAVSGSLTSRVTSRYDGQTSVNTVNVPQGSVSNLHFTRIRKCKEILGVIIPGSCSYLKAQRRLDVLNASSTTFHVDVVFFN